ncbi:MAG: hypothetical protein K8R39_08985 [Arcobacteraceae bacterium]|nr:hypothetical protein [Arcobacteraceae bacterium]
MSQQIVQKFNHFRNYKLDIENKYFINQRPSTLPDIYELIEIATILENHNIQYELTSQFNLKYK